MWTSSMLMGGAGAYLTKSADFDGTDWMERGAGLTGAADGKSGIFSCWLRVDGEGGSFAYILAAVSGLNGNSGRFIIYRTVSSDKISISGANSAATSILGFTSDQTVPVGSGWVHILASWNLATSQFQFYVDDVADTASPGVLTNDTLDYTLPDWGIGAAPGSTAPFNGCLAELYFNSATSLDLSVESNRRKFISTSGKPVSLGANGSRPTGSQPIIYQKIATNGAASDFATNLGSGGNFTITGALTLGSDSPSD